MSSPNILSTRKPVPSYQHNPQHSEHSLQQPLQHPTYPSPSPNGHPGEYVDSWLRSLSHPILPQINTSVSHSNVTAEREGLVKSGSLKITSAVGEIGYWDDFSAQGVPTARQSSVFVRAACRS
ncbi:hypothetical protein BT69DRAFT_1096975 [Atractiella rhizophila]|nr:hypothetical protein BT69DRAFT_1096975 [Atractiella rhizophila]